MTETKSVIYVIQHRNSTASSGSHNYHAKANGQLTVKLYTCMVHINMINNERFYGVISASATKSDIL